MTLRNAVLFLPVLALFGCMDRPITTLPDGALADITPLAVTHEVQNLDDSGPGTLRAAVEAAGNGHVVTFAPVLAGDTIVLASELVINQSLHIVGPTGGITISGNHATRIFRIAGVQEVVLDNLTLTGGNASGSSFNTVGGAILSSAGNLTIRNSTVERSWASNIGGGIEQFGGTLIILNSTISHNGVSPATSAITQFAGGLRVAAGALSVINSTISGNSAEFGGGGIDNHRSTATIIHSTITDNGASYGGGIVNFGTYGQHAVMSVTNSIVARNSAGAVSNGPDIHNISSGAETPHEFVDLTASHSLIGSAIRNDLTAAGNNLIGADPRFEVDGLGKPLLADNGGPTKTHALLETSPAIDVGEAAACTGEPVSGRDQRGVPRPQSAGCDMGSFELAGVAPPPPPPSVSELSITASGTVNKTTGVAVVSGTLTCSTPGVVQLKVDLSQEQKQRRITHTVVGSATFSVSCSGATAWATAVTGSNGVFVNGAAHAAAETLNASPPAVASRSVQLFWSK